MLRIASLLSYFPLSSVSALRSSSSSARSLKAEAIAAASVSSSSSSAISISSGIAVISSSSLLNLASLSSIFFFSLRTACAALRSSQKPGFRLSCSSLSIFTFSPSGSKITSHFPQFVHYLGKLTFYFIQKKHSLFSLYLSLSSCSGEQSLPRSAAAAAESAAAESAARKASAAGEHSAAASSCI